MLSTRNHAFPKFMPLVIRLKAIFCEHRRQAVRLDNVVEISSSAFNDYCMAKEIEVQYSVSYVYTQNGLVGSLIKIILSNYMDKTH
jgi:hypothetical protein